MNPYNTISLHGLNGVVEVQQLNGFLSKVKKTIRKVVKVVAPVVVGFVAGPAAGAAVAKSVIDHNKAKKEAKQTAKDLGLSWSEFQKMSDADIQKRANEVAMGTANPAMGQAAAYAMKAVDGMENAPAVKAVTDKLAASGMSESQRQALFLSSQPVQQAINDATIAGYYQGAQQAGYSPPVAAQVAAGAAQEIQSGVSIEKALPYLAIATALLLNA